MTTDAAARPLARRIVLVVLAATTVAAGLIVHRAGRGEAADIAGDALYAVLIYLLVAFLLPRLRAWRVALLAFAVCAAIELFQLTGLPRVWSAAFPPIGLVLGSGFDARDLVVYAAAAVVAGLVDMGLSRRRPAS